jgi:hypothetical protein
VALRVVIAVAAFVVIAGVAYWLERRRRTDAPPQPIDDAPAQVDRNDFPRPDAPWLVVLFTSKNCESCEGLYDKAKPLESDAVAVTEVEYFEDKALHERYRIEAAPLTVIADAEGVVRDWIVGPYAPTELWTRVAAARDGEPG